MKLLKSTPKTSKKRKSSKKKTSKNKLLALFATPKYIVPVMFVLIFAGVGVWQLVLSKAAVVDRGAVAYVSQSNGCWLTGRVWDNNDCKNKCRSGAGTYVAATSTKRGYCTKALAPTVGSTTCASLGRIFVSNAGCSKRADQTTTAGARQCRYSNNTYYAPSGTDYCALKCPTGLLKGVPSCPALSLVASTATAINPADKNSVNTAYKNLWASGAAVTPGWTGSNSTCSPGNITLAALKAQANALNFARQINGLGVVHAVAITDGNHINAQRTALIMDANGALNHNPTSTWKCYSSAGAATAAKSNISLVYPSTTPIKAIKSYLDEPGSSNTAVGHRRWLFNPSSSVFTFGLTNAASAVQVIGLPQNNTANPTWVEWPSNGYFPNTIEPAGRWSLSSHNDNTDFSRATVGVSYNGSALAVTKYAVHDDYAKPTIVWQMPAGIAKEGTYTVRVAGIYINGSATSYTYTVNLFTPY